MRPSMRRNAGFGLFGKTINVTVEDAQEKWSVYLNSGCVVKSTDNTDLTEVRIKAILGAVGEFECASSGQTHYINKEYNDPNRKAASARYDRASKALEEVKKTHCVVA